MVQCLFAPMTKFFSKLFEEIYKIDRMLPQLQKATVLSNIAGFIFDFCTNCNNFNMSCLGGVGLTKKLTKYLKDVKVPAFAGSMIGHNNKIFAILIGVW